jgi:hypothetical protein
MKRKVISLITILSISASLLVGCGSATNADGTTDISKLSKSALLEKYNELANNYNGLSTQYTEMYNMYQALTTEEQPSSAISVVGDGTGRYTFNSVDAKMIFPSSFQYPSAETIQSNGSINIVQNVQVSPGSNWIFKMNGTTLELEHTSGISGTIKASGVTTQYDKTQLKDEVLSQWFVNVPDAKPVYKDIFIDQTMFGVQATTPIMIDSENAFLRCGMLAYGDYAITYVFVYRGEQDVTKDESITNVLNTIKIMGAEFQVED